PLDCRFCTFFFFQAEDGIRDRNVTGVQTCALPISLPVLEYVTGDMPVLTETFRTNKNRNRSLSELTADYQKKYPDHSIQVGIGHTLSEGKALRLKSAIQELMPEQQVDIRMIGTAFCSHLGKNALSLGLMPVTKEVD